MTQEISQEEFDYQIEKEKLETKIKYPSVDNLLNRCIDNFLYTSTKDSLLNDPITLKDIQRFSNFIYDTESLCVGIEYTQKPVSKNDFLKMLELRKTYETALFTKPEQEEGKKSNKELKLSQDLIKYPIVEQVYHADSTLYYMKLKNGGRIYLHNTNNPNDSLINVTIFAKGGTHMLSDKNYKQFASIWYYLKLAGMGNLDQNELADWCIKYDMHYLPYIDIYDRGAIGSTKKKYISKMLQQILGHFTSIKKDEKQI